MRRFAFASSLLLVTLAALFSQGCLGKPVKVLVRKNDTGVMALVGLTLHTQVLFAAGADDIRERTRLVGDRRVSVEEEYAVTTRSPGKGEPNKVAEWKNNPNNFDFLVNWTIESNENAKTQIAENVKLSVKEIWKVEKVSDPSVTRTWTCSYLLEGGPITASDTVVARLVKDAVAPAREPIVKEIKQFVTSRR